MKNIWHKIFSKNDMKLGHLREKVKNLSSFIIFLEFSIQKKEYLIQALGEKILKCQEELAHSLSIVCKFMLVILKLYEILDSTKVT